MIVGLIRNIRKSKGHVMCLIDQDVISDFAYRTLRLLVLSLQVYIATSYVLSGFPFIYHSRLRKTSQQLSKSVHLNSTSSSISSLSFLSFNRSTQSQHIYLLILQCLLYILIVRLVNRIYNHIFTMDQKTLIVVLTLLASAALFYSHTEQKDDFLQYKKKFSFQWTVEEESFRRLIYLKNLEIIEKHNADSTQTYQMGVNQFTAITDAEFSAIHLIHRQNKNLADQRDYRNAVIGDVDWTTQGKVSPVKNQGNCGSCWAFSAVGVLESWALFKGQTVNLSEQQLVDCSGKYGNQGCNGGFNYQGLKYVKDNGITDQKSYPYTAKTQQCKTNGGSFKISSVLNVKGCTEVQNAIQSHPVGVSADASNWSKYASGVFNNCGRNLNHDIMLVGYSPSAYKIKNSWGTSWGQNGFIRLAPGNTCGICDDLSPWVN